MAEQLQFHHHNQPGYLLHRSATADRIYLADVRHNHNHRTTDTIWVIQAHHIARKEDEQSALRMEKLITTRLLPIKSALPGYLLNMYSLLLRSSGVSFVVGPKQMVTLGSYCIL